MKKYQIQIHWLLFSIIFFVLGFAKVAGEFKNVATPIGYTQTVQLIEAKQVEEVKLYSNKNTAEVYLINDKQRYETTIPNQEAFCEFIQEKISEGQLIQLTVTKKSSNVWLFIDFILGAFYLKLAIKKKEQSDYKPKFSSKSECGQLKLSDDEEDFVDDGPILFANIAGLKEEKAELEEIVDFLKNPQKYFKAGAKMPRGILLSGPPGTGKTLLAKAVSNEANVSFLFACGSDFDEIYVGVGASKVRTLFEKAKKHSPCIIFIDEIDAVGGKRLAGESTGRDQTLDQLLAEMDGMDSQSDVIVLAATNRPESLDPALMRPGRFSRIIEIGLPDVNDREEILHVHGKNKKFMDDIDFADLAKNTAGFSGAELENLLNEAALITVRKGQEVISKESIEEALRKITIGLQKKGRKIPDKAKKLTAYHEAGHAIVAKFLTSQESVKEISIIPRGQAGGYTLQETREDKYYVSKKELLDELVVLLGGRAAEEIALKDISTGASNDIRVATRIAQNMICNYGMSDEIGPVSIETIQEASMFGGQVIGKMITESVKRAETEAKRILGENRALLDMVANVLLDKETISGAELDKIVKAYKNGRTNDV